MLHTNLNTQQSELDQQIYALAKAYLLNQKVVNPEMLERHITISTDTRPDTLAGLYKHLLESAQNTNMSPNVIGNAIGGIDRLNSLLCGFQPKSVVNKYSEDWKKVLEDIIIQIKPRGQIRQTPKSLWPRFCKTIVSGATFLSQFDTSSDFYTWVDFFDRDDRARPSLPMLLSYEIDGFGFPLACDFLKELGYVKFGKPDVHLKKIFTALKLSTEEDNYRMFKAINRVSKNVGVTPYNVDKMFWLIGSGNFYRDGVKIGRHSNKFIDYAKQKLNL